MAQKEYLMLKTSVQNEHRKMLPLADVSLLRPTNSNPLVMGEWVHLNSSHLAVRADGSLFSWLVLDGAGRHDTQALGQVCGIGLHGLIADTLVFDNASPPAHGAALMVATVTNSAAGLTSKSGVKTHGGGSQKIVGYVEKIAADNNGYLRFVLVNQ